MKAKLFIFGDSFSSDHEDAQCWVCGLQDFFELTNFSKRGVSEYRIWKDYKSNQNSIPPGSKILFCHTNPYRIYLKNTCVIMSRNLQSHPCCDIILEDVYSKKEMKIIEAVESIWDEEYLKDHYYFVCDELLKVENSYHISFFDIDRSVVNCKEIWNLFPGSINHMNQNGNILTLEKILSLIPLQ